MIDVASFVWGTTPPAWFVGALSIIVIWSLIWKGLALWHSARKGEYIWFVVILLVNSVGILDIIYLFLIAKKKPDQLFKK